MQREQAHCGLSWRAGNGISNARLENLSIFIGVADNIFHSTSKILNDFFLIYFWLADPVNFVNTYNRCSLESLKLKTAYLLFYV